MSKRAADRYSTARDLADDLRHFLQAEAGTLSPRTVPGPAAAHARFRPGGRPRRRPRRCSRIRAGWPSRSCPRGCDHSTATTPTSSSSCSPAPATATACPRACGSGRRGSSRPTPTSPFKVGLIYGPSGCGKSSLVKAGLLPRLGKDVLTVYVEATPQDTEARLLRGIRKACPESADGHGAGRRPGGAAAGASAARRAEGARSSSISSSSGCLPAAARRRPSSSPHCGNATASTSRRSSWSATTSGWPPPDS